MEQERASEAAMLPLYPAWRPTETGLFTLLFGWIDKAPPPVGSLLVDGETIELRMARVGTVTSVAWERPFALVVTRWPYDDGAGTEVNIGLRQRDVPPGTVWLQFRVMWPSHRVPDTIPIKQERFGFIDPQHMPQLWELVADCAMAHGEDWPNIDLDATSQELTPLRSRGEPVGCVACESFAIAHVASGVYRCNVCGYEGGEGLPRFLAERRRQAFDMLSYHDRLTSARDDLRNAARIGLAVTGHKKALPVPQIGHREEPAHLATLVTVLGQLQEVRLLLQDAAYKWPRRASRLAPLVAMLEFVEKDAADDNLSQRLKRIHELPIEQLVKQLEKERNAMEGALRAAT